MKIFFITIDNIILAFLYIFFSKFIKNTFLIKIKLNCFILLRNSDYLN